MDSSRARTWRGKACLELAVVTVVVLRVFADRRCSVWLVLSTAAAVVVAVALDSGSCCSGARGAGWRWPGGGRPLTVLVVFVVAQLLWVAVVSAVLLGAAVLAGRTLTMPTGG